MWGPAPCAGSEGVVGAFRRVPVPVVKRRIRILVIPHSLRLGAYPARLRGNGHGVSNLRRPIKPRSPLSRSIGHMGVPFKSVHSVHCNARARETSGEHGEEPVGGLRRLQAGSGSTDLSTQVCPWNANIILQWVSANLAALVFAAAAGELSAAAPERRHAPTATNVLRRRTPFGAETGNARL